MVIADIKIARVISGIVATDKSLFRAGAEFI